MSNSIFNFPESKPFWVEISHYIHSGTVLIMNGIQVAQQTALLPTIHPTLSCLLSPKLNYLSSLLSPKLRVINCFCVSLAVCVYISVYDIISEEDDCMYSVKDSYWDSY